MTAKIHLNPTTVVSFYEPVGAYVKGGGQETKYTLFKCLYAPRKTTAVFFCEWRGGFGEQAIAAHAQGVKEFATLRMVFNPVLYDKLRAGGILAVRGNDKRAVWRGVPNKENLNLYELWGAPDDILGEGRFMEFKVRRYGVK